MDAAVGQSELPRERVENYRKLLAELRFQERKMNPEVERQVKENMEENPRSHAQPAQGIVTPNVRAPSFRNELRIAAVGAK